MGISSQIGLSILAWIDELKHLIKWETTSCYLHTHSLSLSVSILLFGNYTNTVVPNWLANELSQTLPELPGIKIGISWLGDRHSTSQPQIVLALEKMKVKYSIQAYQLEISREIKTESESSTIDMIQQLYRPYPQERTCLNRKLNNLRQTSPSNPLGQ